MHKTPYQHKTISSDIAVEGLKTAVMFLETELSVLEHRRTDMYKLLNAFRVLYNAEVGMLLGEILRLRLEEFRRLRDVNPDGERQVEEAEADYARHQQAIGGEPKEVVQTLSKSRDKELQQKFHKASKLCHPDLVEESQKARATEIFMDLNNAYYYNNLDRVSAILEMLEQNTHGLTGRSEGMTTRALLEMHETRLRIDIARLKSEIEVIRHSGPYKTVSEIEEWDDYFAALKGKLTHERDELAARLASNTEGEEA
ncbi:MAG: J domain-containing protein [Bacteroidales bacterium]